MAMTSYADRPATFGRLLRDSRRAAGFTQRDLAELLELSFTYLSKLENDRCPPPAVRTVFRLAAALSVDPLPLLYARHPLPAPLASLSAEQWEALSEWLSGMAPAVERR